MPVNKLSLHSELLQWVSANRNPNFITEDESHCVSQSLLACFEMPSDLYLWKLTCCLVSFVAGVQ